MNKHNDIEDEARLREVFRTATLRGRYWEEPSVMMISLVILLWLNWSRLKSRVSHGSKLWTGVSCE